MTLKKNLVTSDDKKVTFDGIVVWIKRLFSQFYKVFIYSEIKEQYIFSFVAVIAAFLAIPFLIVFFILKSQFLFLLGLFVLVVELLCAYYRRYFITSSLILLTTVNITSFIYAIELGSLGNAHTMFFSIFLFTFVVYFRNYRFIFFINAFQSISIILFLSLKYTSLSSSSLFSDSQIQMVGLIAIAAHVVILGSTIFFQFRSQHFTEKININLLVETFNISQRESDIITLVIEGKTNREISEALFIGLPTVKTHLNQIYRKLGVSNRSSVISLVLQMINTAH